jgi:hypothetical protein
MYVRRVEIGTFGDDQRNKYIYVGKEERRRGRRRMEGGRRGFI